MRIENSGQFGMCRWATKTQGSSDSNIADVAALEFFQHGMSDVRTSLLQGHQPTECAYCHGMEQSGKISGREKQLLKVGVDLEHFQKTMLSSPWSSVFQHSMQNHGDTDQYPQDWQVHLGNYCNSACVFCSPEASSRLATEFKKIGLASRLPPPAWSDNDAALDRFVQILRDSPRLAYLHFIGGETLITPSFLKILRALVASDLQHKVALGFTTNLTVWDTTVVEQLIQFRTVNLGMSIECFHPLNDYVRYGSQLEKTQEILERWRCLATAQGWLMQLRITPTILSIWHLDTVFKYALTTGMAVESCNFLDDPVFMRASVLPSPLRLQVAEKIADLQHLVPQPGPDKIVNTRDPTRCHDQIWQDAQSYVHYLKTCQDESWRLPQLVQYLQQLERSRGNCILDYLPEYEELLRSAGY